MNIIQTDYPVAISHQLATIISHELEASGIDTSSGQGFIVSVQFSHLFKPFTKGHS